MNYNHVVSISPRGFSTHQEKTQIYSWWDREGTDFHIGPEVELEENAINYISITGYDQDKNAISQATFTVITEKF